MSSTAFSSLTPLLAHFIDGVARSFQEEEIEAFGRTHERLLDLTLCAFDDTRFRSNCTIEGGFESPLRLLLFDSSMRLPTSHYPHSLLGFDLE